MPELGLVIDRQYPGLNPVLFGHESHVPLHKYGPGMREYWLIHYIVSGFGTFEYENEQYQVGPGEFFVIPPYVKTAYQADAEKPWSYIWIGFTTEMKLPKQLHERVVNFPEAGHLFEEMKNCMLMGNGKSAFLSGCLWQLIALLLDQSKPKYNFVDEAIAYMHTEYMNRISIQEIAKHLNLDRKYFSSAFSKRIGSSPQQYLMNLRLTKAAELMINFHEPPSVVATLVGYPDLYQFSKMFKQHFGMSPREYVKHHAEKEK